MSLEFITSVPNFQQNSASSCRLVAQRRIDAGICAVPTVVGSKAPSYITNTGEETRLAWNGFLHRLPTPWELSNYFQPARVDNGITGIGILGGKYSIVERDGERYAPVTIDIDDKMTWGDFERLCRKDERAHDILERCLLEHTRRGVHIAALVAALYHTRRLAGEQLPGEKKVRALIELKSNFVVTYPTKGYMQVRGEWHDLPIVSVDDMDYLISKAQSLNKLPYHPSPHIPLHTPVPQKEKPVWSSLKGMLQVKRLFTSNISSPDPDLLTTSSLRQATHRPDYCEKYAAFLELPPPTPGKKFSCVLHPPDNDPSMNWLAPRHEGESWRIVCHHPNESVEHTSLTPPEYYYLKLNGKLPNWKKNKSSFGFWWLKLLVDSGCLAVPDIQFPKLPETAPAYVQKVYPQFCDIYRIRALRSGLHHWLPLVWKFVETVSGGIVKQHYIRKALRWLVAKGIIGCKNNTDSDDLCLYTLLGNRNLRRAMKDKDVDMSRRDLQDVAPANTAMQDEIERTAQDRTSHDEDEMYCSTGTTDPIHPTVANFRGSSPKRQDEGGIWHGLRLC